jgi:hypothetical protein
LTKVIRPIEIRALNFTKKKKYNFQQFKSAYYKIRVKEFLLSILKNSFQSNLNGSIPVIFYNNAHHQSSHLILAAFFSPNSLIYHLLDGDYINRHDVLLEFPTSPVVDILFISLHNTKKLDGGIPFSISRVSAKM